MDEILLLEARATASRFAGNQETRVCWPTPGAKVERVQIAVKSFTLTFENGAWLVERFDANDSPVATVQMSSEELVQKLCAGSVAVPGERVICPKCGHGGTPAEFPPNGVSESPECPNCGYEGTEDQSAWDAQFGGEG